MSGARPRPIKVVGAERMRRIDEIAIRERGIPGIDLMERAGEAVAREVLDRFRPDAVAVFAGKGNNGGDGWVAARVLCRAGVRVVAFATADPATLKGDARAAFERTPPDVPVERLADAAGLAERLPDFDVLVDAILGTGVSGPIAEPLAGIVRAMNDSRVPIVAADIPSGLPADPAPDLEGRAIVRAAVTTTMGLPKFGLVLDPGARHAGVVSIADIGFPRDLLEADDIDAEILGAADVAALLPARPPWGHKGTFGRALILAGSEGMTGAAILAARAAARSGAGLVFVGYPRALGTVLEGALVEPVKRPFAGDAPWFVEENADAALAEAADAEAVAIGPGLGARAATGRFFRRVCEGVRTPLVVDADGLNLLAGDLAAVRGRPGPTILTPHPGEAARLLGTSVATVESDRLGTVRRLAEEAGAVVVLKGSRTLIASPGRAVAINPTGNSGLAKGGSGDVLAGLIVGLLAQGADPTDAARLGAFLHGMAADDAARRIGVRAMVAGDVVESFGRAFRELEAGGAEA